MSNTDHIKFKGEIEKYLRKSNHNFESKIYEAFSILKVKTLLCRANIIKKEGYHAAHLLFTLIILPLLKVNSIRGFCQKHWQHWSKARKDTLYRFKFYTGTKTDLPSGTNGWKSAVSTGPQPQKRSFHLM